MDSSVLDPRDTYADSSEWNDKARKLAQLFIENFEKYSDTPAGAELLDAGPLTEPG